MCSQSPISSYMGPLGAAGRIGLDLEGKGEPLGLEAAALLSNEVGWVGVSAITCHGDTSLVREEGLL